MSEAERERWQWKARKGGVDSHSQCSKGLAHTWFHHKPGAAGLG